MSFWESLPGSLFNWSRDSTLAYAQWGWGVISVQKESEGLGKQCIEMVLLLDKLNSVLHSGFSIKSYRKTWMNILTNSIYATFSETPNTPLDGVDKFQFKICK